MPQKRQVHSVQDRKLLEAIAGSSAFFNLTPEQQAGIAHLSRASWYRRLKSPGYFTLDEFRWMVTRYNWSNDVVLQIVR